MLLIKDGVFRADKETDDYYFSQIFQNAKNTFKCFADTSEYRSWVALKLKMSRHRRAQLVFTLHGYGKPFNGSLICAPFLEFRDMEDEEQGSRQTPITDEGFVFLYSENQQEILQRFRPWCEEALVLAVRELIQNL